MFIIAAEVYIFGALIYIILGQGERQSWAGGEVTREKMKIEIKEQKDLSQTSRKTEHLSIQHPISK